MEKHELPSLSDLKLELKEAGKTAEIALLLCCFQHQRNRKQMSPEPTVSSIVVRADDSPETAYTGGNWRGGEGIVRELCSFLYVNAFFPTLLLIQ